MKQFRKKGRFWRWLGWMLLLCFVFWVGYCGYNYYKSGFVLFELFWQSLQRYAMCFLAPSILCFFLGHIQRRRAYRAQRRRPPL